MPTYNIENKNKLVSDQIQYVQSSINLKKKRFGDLSHHKGLGCKPQNLEFDSPLVHQIPSMQWEERAHGKKQRAF